MEHRPTGMHGARPTLSDVAGMAKFREPVRPPKVALATLNATVPASAAFMSSVLF